MGVAGHEMRTIFFVVFAANVLLMLVSLAILPDRVAIHFGRGGCPDSWASKEINALVFLVLETPMFLLLWFGPSLPLGVPKRFVSLPNKEYWLQEENLPAFKQKMEHLMAQFGAAFFLFFFFTGLLTVQANLSEPVRLNEKAFVPVVVLFLVYTVVWTIGLLRAFRVPDVGGSTTGGPG
jgi:uncharacterized membrane protein